MLRRLGDEPFGAVRIGRFCYDFVTEFDHVTADAQRTFKVKGLKVKVTP